MFWDILNINNIPWIESVSLPQQKWLEPFSTWDFPTKNLISDLNPKDSNVVALYPGVAKKVRYIGNSISCQIGDCGLNGWIVNIFSTIKSMMMYSYPICVESVPDHNNCRNYSYHQKYYLKITFYVHSPCPFLKQMDPQSCVIGSNKTIATTFYSTGTDNEW